MTAASQSLCNIPVVLGTFTRMPGLLDMKSARIVAGTDLRAWPTVRERGELKEGREDESYQTASVSREHCLAY
jgi:hypothetical protein